MKRAQSKNSQYAQSDAKSIVITGEDLTIEKLAAVSRKQVNIEFHKEVPGRVSASRDLLDSLLAQNEVIYGVNTGYGGNVRFLIPRSDLDAHQNNLLRFLCCGVGETLPSDVIRAAMLLRINALSKGFSAIKMPTLALLRQLLNSDIVPIVPRYGSVGASGDLIPSAYIARVLLGEGTVMFRGAKIPASEALRTANLAPIRLRAKEGLALVNGTSVMTAVAALVLHDLDYLVRVCVATVALAIDALRSTADPFIEIIHKVKNHPGQMEVARMLRRFTEGSGLSFSLEELREAVRTYQQPSTTALQVEESIQSPYSLRCAPQGLGPIFEGLEYAAAVLEREMNSVNDNPLVDGQSRGVYYTGNFYGGHIARTMDIMKMDMAALANWMHAIMAMLVDPRFSNGLPANLSSLPGLVTGFKGVQISMTSVVCACRQMAGPSALHTLPTEQYNQDVVSLGLHSATAAMDMVPLVRNAAAMLLIALCQSIELRLREKEATRAGSLAIRLFEVVRKKVPFVDRDQPLDSDIAEVCSLIDQRAFGPLTGE